MVEVSRHTHYAQFGTDRCSCGQRVFIQQHKLTPYRVNVLPENLRAAGDLFEGWKRG